MTAETIITVAEILAAVVLLAIGLQAFFRPRYMISVQKTTNSASQPEVVSYQANLPWWATQHQIWKTTEKLALAGTSRMVTVNELILDMTKKMAEEAAAARPALKDKFTTKLEKRRRKYVAKKLGIPVDQVTDEQIRQVVGLAQAGQVPRAEEVRAEP